MNDFKVTVCCIVFNQETMIRQCLDSILAQKTNFDFELLIHDDASTDSTVAIIQEYVQRYPGKIRTILQKTNQYSNGNDKFLSTVVFPQILSKYIAYCDGDDFWIDDNKLQMQYDFMEANPDFSMCFHDVKLLREDLVHENNYLFYYKSILDNRTEFVFADILKDNFIPACSTFCRTDIMLESAKWINDLPFQDWTLWLLNSRLGKIKLFKAQMAIYRIHHSSNWSSKSNAYQQKNKLKFYQKLLKYLGNEYSQILLDSVLFQAENYIDQNEELNKVKDELQQKIVFQEKFIKEQDSQLKVTSDHLKTDRTELLLLIKIVRTMNRFFQKFPLLKVCFSPLKKFLIFLSRKF